MAAATRGRSGAAAGFGRGGWGSDAVEGGRRKGSCEVQVNGFGFGIWGLIFGFWLNTVVEGGFNDHHDDVDDVDADADNNFIGRGRVFHSLSRAVQVTCEV